VPSPASDSTVPQMAPDKTPLAMLFALALSHCVSPASVCTG
jgi:hypothetical protein